MELINTLKETSELLIEMAIAGATQQDAYVAELVAKAKEED